MSVATDIAELQADVTALQGTLETIRQSLQDQIDLNEIGVTEADTSADLATADTIVNAQDITALNVTLRLYIDSKFAQLRNDISSDFSTTLSSVTPQIESDVDSSFTSQITSINATITTQTNAAASSAYNANQSYLNASAVFTSLVNTDIPDLQARITNAEGVVLQHTNDWTSLLTQYGHSSIQQGFDAQLITTNGAISASATTLKAEIENPAGTSLGATLANNYYTEVDTDAAITASVSSMKTTIEDPLGSSIGADLATNYRTTANTDTAISSAITNVKTEIEDVNGTSLGATVATQQASITDLETGASAGYLVKAQVDVNGNPVAVSLLELIAADGTTSTPTSIAKLQADDILLDGTVSARKLQITDFTDYAQLQKFENAEWADHWTLNQSYGSVSHSAGTGFLNNDALVFASYSNPPHNVRAEFTVDVEPNEHYEIEIWVRRTSNYAPVWAGQPMWGYSYLKAYEGDGQSTPSLNFVNASSGVPVTTSLLELDPQLTNATDFYIVRGTVEIPDDVTQLTLKFIVRNTAGTLSLSSPKVIRKLGGQLIVDGSITANLIEANSITAGKLASAEISTLGLTIGTLSSSSTGERLILKDDSIVVYDANNVVRVKIGDLS